MNGYPARSGNDVRHAPAPSQTKTPIARRSDSQQTCLHAVRPDAAMLAESGGSNLAKQYR
jgi:hypothetical protein